jgi:hypothetical protein
MTDNKNLINTLTFRIGQPYAEIFKTFPNIVDLLLLENPSGSL